MQTESQLLIGGVVAARLAEEYGTPLYVYGAESIRAAFRRIQNAVPYAPRKIDYACVTNSNLAIMRLVRSLGGASTPTRGATR
jgi:diaminopimelate decarboxylase